MLARRVRVEEGTFLQGCWLDWDVIRRELVASSVDLLPDARLEPARPPRRTACPPTRMLASLPVRLVPGELPDEPGPGVVRRSPLALDRLGVPRAGRVGRRRVAPRGPRAERAAGTFVSAVTHELRTPLTTFRLYTEMLDEGMVASPDSQRHYFKTLRAEADRLGHLVENVLAFARLERGRWGENREFVRRAALFDRLAPRLALRARQAGMELVVSPVDSPVNVRVDLSVVDQILSNLVDNAIKYAGCAPTAASTWTSSSTGRWLSLSVRDHGPGLLPSRPAGCSAHSPSRPTTPPSPPPESASASPSAAASPAPRRRPSALEE